ncbi:MAG: alpha/beta hydrolase family protein [Blastocatellia bacterium]
MTLTNGMRGKSPARTGILILVIAGLAMAAVPGFSGTRGAAQKATRKNSGRGGKALAAVTQDKGTQNKAGQDKGARDKAGQKSATAKGGAAKAPGVTWKAEDVKFSGANVQLAGTFLVPRGEAGKRFPTLIIVGDGEPATRDGLRAGEGTHYLYRDLAQHLADKGIAVLRYDHRCVGASDCRQPYSFAEYQQDCEQALKYTRSRPDVDASRIFMLGHGEGGFLAAVIASYDETVAEVKLAGLVLAATSGRFGYRVLREQVKARLEAKGKSPELVAASLARVNTLIDRIRMGDPSKAELDPDPDIEINAMLTRLVKNTAFSFGLLLNDPLQTAKSISAPVLILQGEKDDLVTVNDADYLEEAFVREAHVDCTKKIMPGLDYVFKATGGQPGLKVYADTARPVDQGAMQVIVEWVRKRAKMQ